MFNKYLLALILITLSETVLSAPPVASLRVSGSIIPPSCTLNGLTEETYTYRFNISPDIFPLSGDLRLSPQVRTIEVVCNAATYLSLSTVDERAGTELNTGDSLYGLGIYNTNTKIGYYTVRMNNPTVKTNPDASATEAGILRSGSYSNSFLLNKGTRHSWAVSATQMAAGQVFAADFTITPTINSVMKNNAGDAELDGLAVLTFVFGI
ncbi:fimbrial protein [Klebsiella sp. BIGb0407]|uniref:fimbrial protein n=1 Tax=Klebsiella sp. BIGb0407 TaxID=2940603 RepID=UPI002169FFDE|nr:fimbrial protein [Klebsiella sp. BIGb0407]MCS3433633.1 hypothetical protein [Klebsiella sp. BIGb0407]